MSLFKKDKSAAVARKEKKKRGDIAVVVKEGVGATEKSYVLPKGSVVEDAIIAAGASPKSGSEIRLNGDPTKMSASLKDGDIVLVLRKVSGA